jgi:hypothetical protein
MTVTIVGLAGSAVEERKRDDPVSDGVTVDRSRRAVFG